MKKMAVLEVIINLENDTLVTFDSFIEISVDCFVCQRNHRTIGLKYGDDNAKCFKENHAYPAKIVEMKLTESKRGIIKRFSTIKAEYYIEYDYNEFEDKKYKIPSDGIIEWARVNFKIICPNCNKEIECSTQNNLVRPRSCFCECGHLLFIEKDVMPIIKNNCQ